ncbi:MAG: HIT domain-containing protein [Desulfobacterota bacterium]|nr:HIT domain-containing protein [Thermodesulfobacteriota bacterium]
MKRIWAPWRIQYILGKKEKGCFLCIERNRSVRRTRYILAETEYSAVVLNKYPYATGHLLVMPKRHVPDLDSLTHDEMVDLFMLMKNAAAAIRSALSPDGMNIGINLGKAAGAGLAEHLHIHIVPRWNGDHNFMPVIADTMVLPEHLDAMYARIAPFFSGIGHPL